MLQVVVDDVVKATGETCTSVRSLESRPDAARGSVISILPYNGAAGVDPLYNCVPPTAAALLYDEIAQRIDSTQRGGGIRPHNFSLYPEPRRPS